MFALVFTLIFSILVAYFVTQNTVEFTLYLGSYSIPRVPLYLIILLSVLTGVFFVWIFYFLTSISSTVIIKRKNQALKDAEEENTELRKRVHQLELENTKLVSKDLELISDNSL